MTRRARGRPITGWLAVDKPSGVSSTWAVTRARKQLDARRVGHAGSLDPMATGVLPLAFGDATKTVAFVVDAPKTYEFVVRWGLSTDSHDLDGAVVARNDAPAPTLEEIRACLPEFTGAVMQRPPRFSAVKVNGKRAYALARAGEVVRLEPRPAQVHRLDADSDGADADGPWTAFSAEVGKGFYVRAVARDIAARLGVLGVVARLRRTRVGPFSLDDAIPLDKTAGLVHDDPVRALTSLGRALSGRPRARVSRLDAERLRRGQDALAAGACNDADPNLPLWPHPAVTHENPDAIIFVVDPRRRTRRPRAPRRRSPQTRARIRASFTAPPLRSPATHGRDAMTTLAPARKTQIIRDAARSDTDTGSPEVQAAIHTARINDLMSHFRQHPKDVHSRRGLLRMVARRRRLLEYVLEQDPARHDRLIERLNMRKKRADARR